MKMFQFTPLTRYRIRVVLVLTLIWVCLGVFIEMYNAVSYDPTAKHFFLFFPLGNNVVQHLLITAVGPLLGGLCIGGALVFFLRDKLRKQSFIVKLLVQTVAFAAAVFAIILVVSSVHVWTTGGRFDRTFFDIIYTVGILRLVVIWLLIGIITIVVLDISDKYGKGIMWRIITGKYHRPVVEERIFMFMDLKESTAMTQRLGDEMYFQLLRSVFLLVTDPVLNHEGEIYQYVGDEIVLSWMMDKGLERANSIHCFFSIAREIKNREDEFLRLFGEVPEFKAAIHMGSVVAGEIGVIKKDIVFSGDVLNSTSRILSQTKVYGEDLLVSDLIYEKLKADPSLDFRFLEALVLRGRTSESRIYSVHLKRGK
jgi:adenylate cyclase